MGRNEPIQKTGTVYLDRLTLLATYTLLRNRGLTNIIVLEAIKPGQRLYRGLLEKIGINVAEATFFAGHLKTEKEGAVYLSARRLSGQIALIAASEIIQTETHLHSLNNVYKRNTIQLFIARQLHLHIEYWTVRALVAQVLSGSECAIVWLKKPTLFNGVLLSKMLPGVDLRFYPTNGFWSIRLAMAWILDIARHMKLTLGLGQRGRCFCPTKTQKPSVLMLQEDSIRADRSLRGQPHWLDAGNPSEMFETYVVKLQGTKFTIADDASQLSKTGVSILPTAIFRYAMQAMRNNETLIQIRRDRRTAIWAVFQAHGFANKFLLLRVAALLRQAELMGALALWLNIKVFLTRETQYSMADAMQLVAPDLNVTTIAYQYSNMGIASPIMMSTADKLLVFSDMYKILYQSNGIAPQEFLPTGYLYDGVANLVCKKANKHRETLILAGATFIVCYFDESVQHDCWGLVSKADHLGELHSLVKAILADPEFGVVVKSQFIHNSPSQLYPKDEVIQAAKATGRYLELMEGVHRNDIYPTEAALVADLCIGHKFGATAALEAAVAGVRTVLLDTYGTETLWDTVYAKADIEYETMESIMDAIISYRAGSIAHQTIGDWTPILHHFDSYRDGNAANRLRGIVEQCVTDAEKILK